MLRSPAVAGQFYPADKATLSSTVAAMMPQVAPSDKIEALAVVSPHAGYIYSGKTAGQTFARVSAPRDIIVLGPNHHGLGPPLALMAEGEWEMPMGRISINNELAQLLLSQTALFTADEMAHRQEHSLEVQLPFLQASTDNIRLVPIVVSQLSYEDCHTAGLGIGRAIREYGKPVLMVASTDMTHYESRQAASAKDRLALDRILDLDPQGLYETVIGKRITMCGIMPTTIILTAALELGASKAELISYTDSGETSGDTSQVVGYAGLIIS